jgi:hypothetical protein
MRKRALQDMPEEWREAVDRRDWRRFLSPADKEWTWQDSSAITAIRELLIALADRPREDGDHLPRYEQRAATQGQLRVLQVLAVATAAIKMLEREREILILELRAREVSWDVIAMALECRRQTAHVKYRDLRMNPFWQNRLAYEVDAARRVATEIVRSPDATEEARDQALDFLERSDFPGQVPATTKLARRYR